MSFTHRLVFAAALSALSAHAQVLAPPPLLPGETIVVTGQGCGVVARPRTRAEVAAGRTMEVHLREWRDQEFDKACKPGELLVGPVVRIIDGVFGKRRGDPEWYDFGRAFGIWEYNGERPSVVVNWQGRSAHFPVGIATPDDLARYAASNGFSVTARDGDRSSEVYLGSRELVAKPKNDGGWRIIVEADGNTRSYDCPGADARSCFGLWQQHAGPLVERGRRLLAEARPQMEARKAALAGHLKAAGAGVPAPDARAEAREQAARDGQVFFALVNEGLPTQSGFAVDLYPGAPTCETEPVRVAVTGARTSAQPVVHEVRIKAGRPMSFVMRATHAGPDGKALACTPGALTFVASTDSEYRAVFREEGSSCWVELSALDTDSGSRRRLPVQAKPLKVDGGGRHSCNWE